MFLFLFFLQGDTCPQLGEKSLQVELSKEIDTMYQVQCVTSTSNVESSFNLTITDSGNPLPDSRFITLIKQNHPLLVAEIQVYGGKGRYIKPAGNNTPAVSVKVTVRGTGPTKRPFQGCGYEFYLCVYGFSGDERAYCLSVIYYVWHIHVTVR